MTFLSRFFLAAVAFWSVSSPAFAEDIGVRQKYWDGVVAAKLSGSCTAQMESMRTQYARPELMAIGDSLYNGVQSLRINWWLAEWSAPVTIAMRLGLIDEKASDRTGTRRFYAPQYKSQGASFRNTINYGFNLEGFKLIDLLSIPKQQARLLDDLAFRYGPPNGRVLVDNIAFSGANSIDFAGWTAADYKKAAVKSIAAVKSAGLGGFSKLGDAFFFANAYFVLNPTKNACLDKLSVLDQIQLRHPRRVIINIGSNNGLYRIAYNAEPPSAPACSGTDNDYKSSTGVKRCVPGTIETFVSDKLLADLGGTIERLNKVEGLQAVYINGLGLPSQTANLLPTKSGSTVVNYRSALFDHRPIAAAVIAKTDDIVRRTNARMKAMIDRANADASQAGPHFVYVDVAETLADHDYKSCLVARSEQDCAVKRLKVSQQQFGLPEDAFFDNRPIGATGQSGSQTGKGFKVKVTKGGLFSFDNMHLSSMGYELMAQAAWLKMRGDPAYIPSLRNGVDPCKAKGEPGYEQMKINDCVNLLTTPGWSYADATRRDFVLARIVSSADIKRRDYLRALIAFVSSFGG